MSDPLRIGIVICDRYNMCAGGKCLRAVRAREGAFAAYRGRDVELVGYTTCGGCPGGNIEYAPEEMKKNGAEVIHLATGFLVGYPPCPYHRVLPPLHRGKVRHPGRDRNASDPAEVLSRPHSLRHVEWSRLAGVPGADAERRNYATGVRLKPPGFPVRGEPDGQEALRNTSCASSHCRTDMGRVDRVFGPSP